MNISDLNGKIEIKSAEIVNKEWPVINLIFLADGQIIKKSITPSDLLVAIDFYYHNCTKSVRGYLGDS